MQLISLKCPTCNANIEVNSELTQGTCNYCGATFLIDDEAKRRSQLSEEEGFNFEKGRIRAQKEEEQRVAQEKFKEQQHKERIAEQERLENINKSYKKGLITTFVIVAVVVGGGFLIYLMGMF